MELGKYGNCKRSSLALLMAAMSMQALFTSAVFGIGGNMDANSHTAFMHASLDAKPVTVNPAWSGLLGEYGPDDAILIVFEQGGSLYGTQAGAASQQFIEQADGSFHFAKQSASFTLTASGRATGLIRNGISTARRNIEPEVGQSFKVHPEEPISTLRDVAIGATAPTEEGDFVASDLYDVTRVSKTIKLDIRYAGHNNFIGEPVYADAKAFLQRPAAMALGRAHEALAKYGYGLLIHDAYRPWYVTKIFWDATPESGKIFVANPADGSRHNRGAAVDLTLYDLKTGSPIKMVGTYDEMSARSYPDYRGGTSLERWHRDLLRHAMEAEGFTVYEAEWWHFDFRGWPKYRLMNQTFDQLSLSKE
ncbi:MAG: M15 family metallopeptidase [Kordiimonadaceae bacterium]|nr:M15 family metallopeptidase [Kordiimonadaceae bacterium]